MDNSYLTTIRENYGLVSGYLKSEKVNIFNSLKNEEEKIKFIFEKEAFWPLLQRVNKNHREAQGKDKQISKSLRDAGNDAFKNEKDGEALDFYNQAILLAPCDSSGKGEDLSIGLANRAAVLLRQEKFSHCLQDLELATLSGYPDHLKYKVLQRHAYALSEMFRFKDAEVKYLQAIETLKDSRLTKDQKEQLTKEMRKSIDEIKKKHGLEKAVKDFIKTPQMAVPVDMRMDKLTIKRLRHHPSFSKDLTITEGETEKFSVKAKQNLPAGTVIALEDSLSHTLHPDEQLTHCTHCVAPVVLPVPCFDCINVIFCSAKCRDFAWDSYHKFECFLVEGANFLKEEVRLALRLICNKRENLSELQKEIQISKVAREIDQEEDLTILTICCLLVNHLKKNNFFNGCTQELTSEEISACLILRDVVGICLNRSQSIFEVDAWDVNKGLDLKSIGLNYNPMMAKLKHSCDPNTARCNLGPSTFLIATRNILMDEEITYSYKATFQDFSQSDREAILWDTFQMKCECQACEENWPTGQKLLKTVIKKGMEKFVPDLKRNYATVINESSKDLQNGYYDKVFQLWASYCENLSRVVQTPHQGFLRVSKEIQNCAWLKYGNHRPKLKAPVYKNHLKQVSDDEDSV